MDSLSQYLSKLSKNFKALSPSKRLVILIVTAASLVSIGVFIVFVSQKDYRVLFSNLSPEDTERIVSVLQKKGVSYKIGPAGDSILVPSDQVSKLRLDLASSGLPQNGGIGFEIFDKKNFGATEFVQRINYQRALQGELARTIDSLDEVQYSRVHIVMPQKSLFIKEEKKPTAAVIIKLKPGRRLQRSQIEGIAHLVASSVEGLSPERVTIVGSDGNILSNLQPESQSSKITDAQREYQESMEAEIANRIQTMLERVVGPGNVVARVSADLDFRSIEETKETYDPEEPVARSLHRRTKISYAPINGGQSTISPIKKKINSSYSTKQEEKDETINYEINRVISKIVMPVGKINRLSVAVLIDGIYHKNNKGIEEFQPRPKKEMKSLENIVKNSVGFDASRGDQVIVACVPFKKIGLDMGSNKETFWDNGLVFLMPVIKYFISLIALIFVIFFVLRPLIKLFLKDQEDTVAEVTPAIDNQLEDNPVLLAPEEEVEGIEVVRNLASQDARKFAELLRNWLK